MARTRSSNKSTQADEAQNQEAPVSTDTSVAPEATEEAPTTEASETPAAEASTEVEIDLTDFQAAVAAALESKDDSTGDVAAEPLSKVTDQYRKLDGPKAKNKAKAFINDAMKSAMNDMNIAEARAYLQISENALSAGTSGGSATKAPADPTEAFVQRVVTLTLAYQLVTGSVPEGVGEDWNAKVEDALNGKLDVAQGYRTWVESDADDKGDEPEVDAVVKNAVKLAEGKSARAGSSRTGGGSTFQGERRDIGKHILSAFADEEEGKFLSIAEIRKHKSEEYGDAEPSAGAISARLFPNGDASKCTLIKDGVQPGTNEAGKKGATKVATA